MSEFALYRLPRQPSVNVLVQTHGEIEKLGDYKDLDGCSGFVIAPFAISEETPLLLMKPDIRLQVNGKNAYVDICRVLGAGQDTHYLRSGNQDPQSEKAQREIYSQDFRKFHKALREKRFRKLVLARQTRVSTRIQNPIDLFSRACELYPRMFISLFSTSRSGTWLMATPEILLSGNVGKFWKTMALAGTMALEGKDLGFDNPTLDNVQDIRWSQKNIQEQRYVATYVAECIRRYAHNVTEEGPDTVRAANLVHLRSDFRFALKNGNAIGELVGTLHPTPAVCGIEKRKAQQFILENESITRRYYSGFAGEFSTSGSTHLFVSLRCMEILQDGYELYAGGGLLKDSEEQKEWEETVSKMETMRNIII